MKDESCIFCKIAAREISADVLHVTDTVMAFSDLNPQAPTHVLLIPRDHIASLEDVTAADGGLLVDLVQAATHLAKTEGLSDGWRLVSNVGPAGGQSVFHLHFHLLGGRQMTWPPG